MWQHNLTPHSPQNRRRLPPSPASAWLRRSLASNALRAGNSGLDANPLAPRLGHYPGKIKRIIFLFMNGGPSHVDSFDPKPELTRHHGEKLPESFVGKNTRRRDGKLLQSPFPWQQHGESGIEVSDLFPHMAARIDKLCVLRSMWSDNPNHEPGLLLMNTGNMQPIRPSMGSWLTTLSAARIRICLVTSSCAPANQWLDLICGAMVFFPAYTRGRRSIRRTPTPKR